MWQNCPFDTWHAMMSVLSGNDIYCESDLFGRYSSQMEYLNDFFRTGWANGMLCTLHRLNWSDCQLGGCATQHTEHQTTWTIGVSWAYTCTKCFQLPIDVELTEGVKLVDFLVWSVIA